jgi:hypothetical protein
MELVADMCGVTGGPMRARRRYVQVEAQRRAVFYEVDLDRRTCSCGRRRHARCVHLSKAIDLHEEGAARFRYELASALHKEIRRGDLTAALHWADLRALATPDGGEHVKRYARQICGEETRNAKYIWMSLEPSAKLGYRDYVATITQSRKKWELASTWPLFKAQMRGWKRAKSGRTKSKWYRRSLVPSMRVASETRDAAILHEGFWWACLYLGDERPEWDLLDELLANAVSAQCPKIARPREMIAAFESATKRCAFEIRLMFIEALCGGWDETMNEPRHHAGELVPVSDGATIRRFPDYVYDAHVRRRARRVRRWRKSLEPGRESPGRLDLRWSGEMIGVAWRYAAYKQLGAGYRDAPWEDVGIASADWELVLEYGEDDS